MRVKRGLAPHSKTIGMVGLLCLLIVLGGCAAAPRVNVGPVVEADELANRLSGKVATPRLVVLDARADRAYLRGHVAGAVRVDPQEWQDDSLAARTGLDHETLWRARIAALGVSGQDPVIIYDDGRMTDAARIWFILQHFGVAEAGVLNGGYPALDPLVAAGTIATSRAVTAARPTDLRMPVGPRGQIALIERQGVRQAVDRDDAQILDARTTAEYTGKDRRNNPRGGHLPDAISLPHKTLLDEHGRLKSPEELSAIFDQAGLQHGEPIITHCDGGGRASLAALAAARAGYGPVMNYYLSFGDWASDATCPLVGPDEKR